MMETVSVVESMDYKRRLEEARRQNRLLRRECLQRLVINMKDAKTIEELEEALAEKENGKEVSCVAG